MAASRAASAKHLQYHTCASWNRFNALSFYLQGKTGYFQWREDLKKTHAATVVGIMQHAGYDQESQDRVTRFILKKDLKKDPENQVCCIVYKAAEVNRRQLNNRQLNQS